MTDYLKPSFSVACDCGSDEPARRWAETFEIDWGRNPLAIDVFDAMIAVGVSRDVAVAAMLRLCPRRHV